MPDPDPEGTYSPAALDIVLGYVVRNPDPECEPLLWEGDEG